MDPAVNLVGKEGSAEPRSPRARVQPPPTRSVPFESGLLWLPTNTRTYEKAKAYCMTSFAKRTGFVASGFASL